MQGVERIIRMMKGSENTPSEDKLRMLLSKRRLQSDLMITCKFLCWEIKFGHKRPINLEDKGTFIIKVRHQSWVNTS